MSTADFMSEKDRQDLRDAGRGHLLGDYRSPLDVADEARKRAKEEPQMNTDKAEIESAKPSMDEAMTGQVNPVVDSNDQAQNDGDDDIEVDEDENDDSANDDELGPDPFE